MKKIRDWFKKIGKSLKFDLSDFFGLVALGMIFKGLYLYNPIYAWVGVGGILLILSIFMGIKK